MINKTQYIIVDTCFWISLISSDLEENTKKAKFYYKNIKHKIIIFTWPTYYEILRYKFFKKTYNLEIFKKATKGLKIIKIPDDEYREKALSLTLTESNENKVNKKILSTIYL